MYRTRRLLLVLVAGALLVLVAGCSGRNPAELPIARAAIDPVVFDDAYGGDVYPQAFAGTYVDAVSIDSTYAYDGKYALRITVPGQGSALGAYAGGVLTSSAVRDLTEFNALTFWARASVVCTLNEVGFGNDNTGTSRFGASRLNVPLTTAWKQVVVPIPDPSKLIAERGLFLYAEGVEALHPLGYDLWFDRIEFAHLDSITDPRPSLPASDQQYFVGQTVSLAGTQTTFAVDGTDVVVSHQPGYFDYQSSDPGVARVTDGVIKVVGTGSATITATLGGVAATGEVTVTGFTPPTTAAPVPTLPAADVISMYSDAYANVTVDSWNTHWVYSTTEDAITSVAGDPVRLYTNLNFVGIDFAAHTIDAAAMTHLHLDVFAPVGTDFKVKVVAFNDDGGHAIGESELTFTATTQPAFVAAQWSSLDIPLTDFALAAGWDHIGQLILSTDDARLVLVDNVYWHR